MKYKLAGIISFICLIIVTVTVSFVMTDNGNVIRVHHHVAAEEKEQCKVHTNNEFCTHLPLVVVNTYGKTIPGSSTGELDRFNEEIYTTTENGEIMEEVSVSVIDNEKKNNHLTDKPNFTTKTLIRSRGHASRNFEKQQYLLKFVDDEGNDNDLNVMGMEQHNEWVLNGPYLDKSLVRNYMFYNISGEIMEYAPNVRYCELFIDDDYKGLYLMTEPVSNGNNCRLDLTITEKGEKFSGYLCKLDRATETDVQSVRGIFPLSERTNYLPTDMLIRYPGKDTITPEYAKEIELEISQFDKTVTSYDYDSENYGYEQYVDMANIVDYFIINEFSKNMDAGRYSTYIYKRPGEKYKFCVWDFNNSCDNFPTDVTGYEGFSVHSRPYFTAFSRDEKFTQEVVRRYRELRKMYLSDEHINHYIDDTIEFLGPALERNNQRWGEYMSSSPLVPQERNIHSQAEAIVQLKQWLYNRGKWLDDNIETLLQYSAESKVKKYNEVAE